MAGASAGQERLMQEEPGSEAGAGDCVWIEFKLRNYWRILFSAGEGHEQTCIFLNYCVC